MVPDVDWVTRWRGQTDTWHGSLLLASLLSIVLHLVPFVAYVVAALLGLPVDQQFRWADVDHPTVIPIDLGLDEDIQPEPMPLQQHTARAPDTTAGPGEKAGLGGADAGRSVDASTDAGVDAPHEAAPPDASGKRAEAGPAMIALHTDASADTLADDSGALALAADASTDGAAEQPFHAIRDPVGLAGAAKAIAPRDPNVSVILYPERIRRHPLASRFAPTLTRIPQWGSFFAGTGLDPIRDTDRILLAGPQFRDSSRVVAVIGYNVPQPKVRAAIDLLVRRSGPDGVWLDARVPAAKAIVDHAPRYFVLPAPRLVVVVPPDGLDQALRLPPTTRVPPAEDEAVVLFLKTPRNAFVGLPIRIPESIAWMRFSLTLDADSGAFARLDSKDKDEQSARAHAEQLTRDLEPLLVVDWLFAKTRLLDPVAFRADGDHIRTEFRVTEAQLSRILSLIATEIERLATQKDGGVVAVPDL